MSPISSTQQAFQEEILLLDPGSLPDKARKEDIAVSTPCNNQTSDANIISLYNANFAINSFCKGAVCHDILKLCTLIKPERLIENYVLKGNL